MIADRTYHRLLHVEWIRADVDGDGTAELIPQSDRVATASRSVPTRCCRQTRGSGLKIQGSTPPPAPTTEKPGFYIGGNIYRDWASVPETPACLIRTGRTRAGPRPASSASSGNGLPQTGTPERSSVAPRSAAL